MLPVGKGREENSAASVLNQISSSPSAEIALTVSSAIEVVLVSQGCFGLRSHSSPAVLKIHRVPVADAENEDSPATPGGNGAGAQAEPSKCRSSDDWSAQIERSLST